LFICTLFLSLSQSFGQKTLPFYENFDYTIGETLIGNSLWTSVTAATTSPDDVIVASPGWTTSGIAPYGGNALSILGGNTDPQILFTNQTAGTVYFSFLTIISDNVNYTGADPGIQFIGSGQASTTTPANTNYACSIFIRKVAGGFNLGINRGSATTDTQWSSTVYLFDTEYFIAASYTFDSTNPTVKLWVNPGNGAVPAIEPTATVTSNVGSNRLSLDRIYIRQNSNALTPGIIIDELRVGLSWNLGTGTPLGLSKNAISGLSLYPNPVANGKLFISSSNSSKKQVAIYNLLGQKLLDTKTSNNSEVNVSQLAKGTYILNITVDGASESKKLMIQ
ncbi:MAG: T9SS type A sorting domain-containing protein, partial [Flavobacterium sp.]|nr:T9SS type A sorting domain-containing protein [Flavobacterium sp.]